MLAASDEAKQHFFRQLLAHLHAIPGIAAAATIGGMAAKVSFSGLASRFVGLYQINAQVPANAPTGDGVPVVISIGGANSNTVTIAVQ